MSSIKDFGNDILSGAAKVGENIKNIFTSATDVVTNPIEDIKLIKIKNEEIKKFIEEADKKINPVREETNKKLEELGKIKIDIISTTLEEFALHMAAIKNLPFTKGDNLNSAANKSFNFSQQKFNDIQVSVLSRKGLIKVERALMEAREYLDNAILVINKFNELSKFINNTMSITQRYNTECIKLNKQTANIRLYAGDNYNKYTQEQQLLIQKNMLYVAGLLKMLNTPILDEDGSIHKEIMQTMTHSNNFLNKAGEIVFIDFKKQNLPVWVLIALIIATLFGLSTVLYFWIL